MRRDLMPGSQRRAGDWGVRRHHERANPPAGHAVRLAGGERVYDRRRILIVVLLPLGMALMAVSAVNVTLPTIAARLGAGPADLQWVLSGYALAFGVVLVPAGRAGDVLGRGTVFLAGLGIFVLGSLACGLAATPALLNLARIAQGIGAGVFNPQIPGMIQEYFSGRARAKAFALFGMVISVAVAVGPLLAGGVISWLGPDLGWRASFLVYLPVGLAAIGLGVAWLPLERHRLRTRIDLDPVGSVLLAAAVLAVMVPFVLRTTTGWALLAAAPPLGWAWLRWERRYAARGGEPMVDPGLFAIASFAAGTAVSGWLLLGQTTTFVVLALYLQTRLGVSALATGLVGLPNAVAAAIAAGWAGRRVLERGREIVVGGLVAAVLGTLGAVAAMALIESAGLSYWWLAVPLAAAGAGMGAINPPNQMLTLLDVPIDRTGTAAGAKYTAERIGTAVGTATITGVYFAVLGGGNWMAAFAAAYGVIALATLIALVVAVRDARRHAASAAAATTAARPR